VVQPTVLLLDEPLSNLDANLREEMRYEIRRLHDEFRVTTVYVTHDQAEAMVTSDRIAVMNAGRVEQVDAPRALYARPRTRFVAGFIGRTNFLEGDVRGDDVVFDHFTIPRARFVEAAELRGRVSFSLRPQSIHLHRVQADQRGVPLRGGGGMRDRRRDRPRSACAPAQGRRSADGRRGGHAGCRMLRGDEAPCRVVI